MKPYSPNKVSLVLADVDGTLVTNDKLLTPRAKQAVTSLRAAGIAFAITSGRPPRGLKSIIEDLGIDTVVAGFNGGVFTTPELDVVLSRFLDRAMAQHTLRLLSEHQLTAWLYTDTDWYVPDPDGPHVARETATVDFEAKVAQHFEPLLERAVKIVGVSDDLDAVASCEAAMQAALGDDASAERSQPYYLDVTHSKATKGAVVEYLSETMSIPRPEIATLGDMPNDVPMFDNSGMSIAMGNASGEVQAQANFTTLGNDEDGFARGVETHVLGERQERGHGT